MVMKKVKATATLKTVAGAGKKSAKLVSMEEEATMAAMVDVLRKAASSKERAYLYLVDCYCRFVAGRERRD